MDLITIFVGLVGGVVGFLIPGFAKRITVYKASLRDKEIKGDYFDGRIVQVLICIVNGLLWAMSWYKAVNPFSAILASILFSLAIIFIIIDVRIRIIPNELVLATVIAGGMFQLVSFGLKAFLISLASMVVIMAILIVLGLVVGLSKVGAGDIKLMGAMGMSLGYPDIVTAVMMMTIVLLIYIGIGFARKRLTKKSTFPYAPFMMIGMISALIAVLWGVSFDMLINAMLNAYTNLLAGI